MMNLDQARAGGEGLVGVKKNPKGKNKNVELGDDTPSIFETDENPLKISVPEGWAVKKNKD